MPGQKTDERDDAAPEFSDDALVQLFVHECGRDWIYVAVWGQWFRWTRNVWKRDTVSAVVHAVRLVCRTSANKNNKPADQRRLASAKTILAVAKLAGAEGPLHLPRQPDR